MARAFTLPDLCESIHEAEILEVLVKEGAPVEEGDAIMVVETDNAMVEVPSPFTGSIAKIHVAASEVVQVGDVLISFDEAPAAAGAPAEEAAAKQEPTPAAVSTPAAGAASPIPAPLPTSGWQMYPRFNASLDIEAEEIILKQYYHLSVAVDTERGLIVPVIHDVDRKSLAELAAELPDVAQRARAGEIQLEEMQGGTFTITNIGSLGGRSFTPLINAPQVAILGMARASWQPVVRRRDDTPEMTIVPRYLLPLILAFDHRVLDGADAARFLGQVIHLLENPTSFILGV